MPKVASFRANSVIYFEGDVSDKIFVLQKGRVTLKYTDIETGADVHDMIATGEFFGVKSALGRYPREENALVVEDAQVLVFAVPEFEQFAGANSRIIIKMLKVFSNQLRRIHRQVENLMEKQEALSPEAGLFRTGEYYLKNRMYSQAKYVFGRYLTYYPAGKQAEVSARHLEAAETALVRYGDGKGPAIATGGTASAPPRTQAAERSPEAATKKPDPAPLSDAAKSYYNAVSLFSQEKYKEALGEFKAIMDGGGDSEYGPKAAFDFGRSLYMLQQYDLTIKHYTQMVQTAPRHPDLLDILLYLGHSWEKKGDVERAKGFYRKILSMEQDEDHATHIKARKSLKSLEEGARG